MKTVGIIAEYNPFHNGHLYQLQTLKESGYDYIIIVMGGNFLQRGIPAMIGKYERTKMALFCGADLVIELPALYACSSAQYFARGAVSILDKLGVLDALSFGCETSDFTRLKNTASFLYQKTPQYDTLLRSYQKQGYSFPKARETALSSLYDPDIKLLLSSPNNILALEYCLALLERRSHIEPVFLQRTGASYHETNLQTDSFSCARAIRNRLVERFDPEIESALPAFVFSLLKDSYNKTYPVLLDDFSSLLHYQLLLMEKKGYDSYADVNSFLSDKISRHVNGFCSFTQFADLLKSKDITHAHITRALTHILLNISDTMIREAKENDYASYARVLGFTKHAAPLLKKIKSNSSIPLITRLSSQMKKLPPAAVSSLELDVLSSHIYESIVSKKFQTPFLNEYTQQIIRL